MLPILLLFQVSTGRVLAQGTLNGTFEDDLGDFDLNGWTWDCEDPEPDAGYMSNWGVKKLTAVTGVPPEPCSGVTIMHHAIPDDPLATYTITGWAYVDDPNMSASIGFGSSDGTHTGDYTNSTSWTFLSYSDPHIYLFLGSPPLASLNVSDGQDGYGYGHFDGLELTITPLSTGLPGSGAPPPRVSLSPDGTQLAIWAPDGGQRSIQVFDAMGRSERFVLFGSSGTTDPLIIDAAPLDAGLHLVVIRDEQGAHTARFVKN